MYNKHLCVWKHGHFYYIYTQAYDVVTLETPNLCDSRVVCVVPNEEKCKRSRSRPGSDSPALVSVWKVLRRTQSNHSTIVSNYHGHLETCWACNAQYQEDSLYPLSLTASLRDISLHDSLSLPPALSVPLSFAFTVPAWGTFWVSSWDTFQNKRIIVNRNVVRKMKLCGLKHHDFPRNPLVTLSDRWQCQVTHDQRRRQNKHNPTKTSACVFALSCGRVSYTTE